MSEKINDNIPEELQPETVDKPFTPENVTYEENDNWQFDAEAPTIAEDFLEGNAIEVVLPEAEAPAEKEETEKVAHPKEKPSSVKQAKKDEAPKAEKKKTGNKGKIICTVIIGALVVAALVVLGVRYYTVPNNEEKMNPGNVAVTVGDLDVSIGMYNYYYNAVSQRYISYAQNGYYDLDTSVSYSEQYTTNADGKRVTWAKLFEEDTLYQLQYISAYYQDAKEHGITLTDTQKESIKEDLASIKESASNSDMAVDEYISASYGEYCGYATLKKMLEQAYLANNYYRQSLIENKVSEKDIEKYYEKHQDDYAQVSFAYLQLPYESGNDSAKAEIAEKGAKYASQIKSINDLKKLIPTACKDMIDQYVSAGYFEDADACAEALAQNVETTITKSDTSFTEEGINWLFSDKTKKGDTASFVDEQNAVVFVILKTGDVSVADEEVYTVRHILVLPQSEEEKEDEEEAQEEETTYTEEEWNTAEKKAEDILNEFNVGDQSEYSFALLAEKYSDDTESTSAGSSGLYGGLIAKVPEGQMVKEFETWSLDKKRKYGDTDIVKSKYGYHVMYFVEQTKSYLYDCEQALIAENENKYIDSFKVKQHKAAMKKTTVAKPTASEDDE